MATRRHGRLPSLGFAPVVAGLLALVGAARAETAFVPLEQDGSPVAACSGSLPNDGGIDVVEAMAFSPDGEELLLGCRSGALELRTVEGRLRFRRQPDDQFIQQVAITPDGTELLSASANTVRRWRRDGTLLGQFSPGEAPEETVTTVGVSPDGRSLITGHGNASVRFWTATGVLQRHLAAPGVTGGSERVVAVSVLSGGAGIAVAHEGGIVRLWSSSGVPLSEIDTDLSPLRSLASTGNGELVAAGWFGAGRWDAGGRKQGILRDGGIVDGMQLLPDGRGVLLAGREADGFVELRDLDGQLQMTIRFDGDSTDGPLALSSDGRVLFLADGDRLYSAELPGGAR